MNQDKIKKIVEDIFKYTNCTISKCEVSLDGDAIWCMVDTPDSSFMIGRDGETLRSLNHIIQKMIEKDYITNGTMEVKGPNVFIDVNGYQKKRFDNLKNIAHMMAERARYFKSNIEIEPMPAYERRIIHMFLEDARDIKTESEGYGVNRKVVIKYVDSNI
jgi:spoIIIJ-associated protein